MKTGQKQQKIMRWTARIIALVVLVFGLPFYVGYGNPLPFINPNYSLWDNVWLTTFPLMFVGLGLGWKYEIIGGYLVAVPLTLSLLFGLITENELVVHMIVPLLSGVLFLIVGYKNAA